MGRAQAPAASADRLTHRVAAEVLNPLNEHVIGPLAQALASNLETKAMMRRRDDHKMEHDHYREKYARLEADLVGMCGGDKRRKAEERLGRNQEKLAAARAQLEASTRDLTAIFAARQQEQAPFFAAAEEDTLRRCVRRFFELGAAFAAGDGNAAQGAAPPRRCPRRVSRVDIASSPRGPRGDGPPRTAAAPPRQSLARTAPGASASAARGGNPFGAAVDRAGPRDRGPGAARSAGRAAAQGGPGAEPVCPPRPRNPFAPEAQGPAARAGAPGDATAARDVRGRQPRRRPAGGRGSGARAARGDRARRAGHRPAA